MRDGAIKMIFLDRFHLLLDFKNLKGESDPQLRGNFYFTTVRDKGLQTPLKCLKIL